MNKDNLFTQKRSVDLDFGTIGYRRSREVKPLPKKTLAHILEKLQTHGFLDAIRTKRQSGNKSSAVTNTSCCDKRSINMVCQT